LTKSALLMSAFTRRYKSMRRFKLLERMEPSDMTGVYLIESVRFITIKIRTSSLFLPMMWYSLKASSST
jgi:hypothetical protein